MNVKGVGLLAVLATAAVVPAFAEVELDCDRDRVLKTFAENVYGVRPEFRYERKAEVVDSHEVTLTNGVKALRKTIRLNTMTPLGEKTFEAIGYYPVKAAKSPVFVYMAFRPSTLTDNSRWPLELIVGRGAATVCFCYHDVLKDEKTVLDGIERADNAWGAISTWAYAASRVRDYLETDPQADTAKIAIVGHSRLGKTSLWTGANDPRFALTCVNDSGCFGARMMSRNIGGETIDQITKVFPHWFAPNCRKLWLGKDKSLPFDQHSLLAAVSPRMLAVGSAEDDWWACPSGEMAGWEISRNAWKDRAATSYHVRHGKHDLNAEDWSEYLDFAARRGWPITSGR